MQLSLMPSVAIFSSLLLSLVSGIYMYLHEYQKTMQVPLNPTMFCSLYK